MKYNTQEEWDHMYIMRRMENFWLIVVAIVKLFLLG